MMHIRQRILAARNDALMSGHRPIRARISPADMRMLDHWIQQQQHPLDSGMPAQRIDKKALFGMEIVEDASVREILKFDFEKVGT